MTWPLGVRTLLSLVWVVVCGLAVTAQEPSFEWTHYWQVPRDAWQKVVWDPPEKAVLDAAGRGDVGVAFSGGGTRAAAAAVGQPRGLHANGWLDRHVRYISAVSGGSWTAVPFTYGDADVDILLGTITSPGDLSKAVVEAELPEGALARSVARSKLLAPGAAEAAKIWARAELEQRDISSEIRSFTRRFVRGSTSQTYANVLGRLFIEPHVAEGTEFRYTWNEASMDAIKALNPQLSLAEFIRAAEGRPFLIAGGTIIAPHPAREYPLLIPVEFTPLCTGVRQPFGNRLGGLYVSPYAYDVAVADQIDGDRLRVTPRGETRPFTLADVIASSGAAPLLALSRGQPVSAATRGTAVFPSFSHFTVRERERGPAVQPLTESLLPRRRRVHRQPWGHAAIGAWRQEGPGLCQRERTVRAQQADRVNVLVTRPAGGYRW